MTTVKVTFHKIVVDEQVLGGKDECILSTLFFTLEMNGKKHENLSVALKQVVGTTYNEKAIEVGSPTEYKGPFNYDHFRKAASDYYRVDAGAFASLLRVYESNTVNLKRMTFEQEVTFEMPVEDVL
jgi:hypothetical protein